MICAENDILSRLSYNIRKDVLDMTLHAGANGGHIGGAFSCADILAVLYGNVIRKGLDKFILSKGHVALAHYAVLAECGYFEKEKLLSFEDPGSMLTTHEILGNLPGLEVTGGSLGYGISIACGIALARRTNFPESQIYVLVGDGECNEGSIWEGVMTASKLHLDNVTVIVDQNKLQLDGFSSHVMPINISKMFEALGWNVVPVDGHDFVQLRKAFQCSKKGAPTVIVADTIKGKGIPSIENREQLHHMRLSQEDYEKYAQELEASYA